MTTLYNHRYERLWQQGYDYNVFIFQTIDKVNVFGETSITWTDVASIYS